MGKKNNMSTHICTPSDNFIETLKSGLDSISIKNEKFFYTNQSLCTSELEGTFVYELMKYGKIKEVMEWIKEIVVNVIHNEVQCKFFVQTQEGENYAGQDTCEYEILDLSFSLNEDNTILHVRVAVLVK